tara:strand:+ start:264 stop:407 length:144 start_codon:yes stop_codon:yes gene_type:complete
MILLPANTQWIIVVDSFQGFLYLHLYLRYSFYVFYYFAGLILVCFFL